MQAVPDGEAALEAARAVPPDLVLSDVMMPRLDGFGLLRALRADERTRQLPVILLSARAGEESAVEGLDAGADDYLVKPFSARELLARVRTHLDLARQRRGLERELERRVAARTAEVARLTRVLQMLSGINSALVRIREPRGSHARDLPSRAPPRWLRHRPWLRLSIPRRGWPAQPGGPASTSSLTRDASSRSQIAKRGDTTLMGSVIRTGEAVLCEDIERFPYVIDGREDQIAVGVRSLACLPLRVDNTPVGSILCGAAAGHRARTRCCCSRKWRRTCRLRSSTSTSRRRCTFSRISSR